MKARLIRRTPSTQLLLGECLRGRDGTEEIHPPACATKASLGHVKQCKWDLNVRYPDLSFAIECCFRHHPIPNGIRNEGMVHWRIFRAHARRIVYKRLVGDVVRVYFEFEVRLWCLMAALYKRLHHRVLPDVVVHSLLGVEMEILFVECRERQMKHGRVFGGFGTVAEVDLSLGEFHSLRD